MLLGDITCSPGNIPYYFVPDGIGGRWSHLAKPHTYCSVSPNFSTLKCAETPRKTTVIHK